MIDHRFLVCSYSASTVHASILCMPPPAELTSSLQKTVLAQRPVDGPGPLAAMYQSGIEEVVADHPDRSVGESSIGVLAGARSAPPGLSQRQRTVIFGGTVAGLYAAPMEPAHA